MTRRFFIEGLTLDLPLRRDGVTGQAILDYGPVIDHPPCTPEGRPILLTIEDACPQAEMAGGTPPGIDCGACRHYHQFPGSLLGVCKNEKRRKKKRRARRGGPTPKSKEET